MDYNVHEAKANLSKLLKFIQNGKKVYICKRNIRIAELTPVKPPTKKGKRTLGGYEGKIIVHDSFYEPMSEEELKEWYESPIFPKES
jgi:antitoxin (DNA-binding transcriptional repressor) of toxin-antitoxin stability system